MLPERQMGAAHQACKRGKRNGAMSHIGGQRGHMPAYPGSVCRCSGKREDPKYSFATTHSRRNLIYVFAGDCGGAHHVCPRVPPTHVVTCLRSPSRAPSDALTKQPMVSCISLLAQGNGCCLVLPDSVSVPDHALRCVCHKEITKEKTQAEF